jgi:hypothetical protein
MGLFLGDTPVEIYFNGTSASLPVQGVFLGPVQVFPTGAAVTVPGAPTIDFAAALPDEFPQDSSFSLHFFPPESDGGSEITSYLYFIDGEPFTTPPTEPPNSDGNPDTIDVLWQGSGDPVVDYSDFVGKSVQVRAVNAVGEGPLSEPFEILEN